MARHLCVARCSLNKWTNLQCLACLKTLSECSSEEVSLTQSRLRALEQPRKVPGKAEETESSSAPLDAALLSWRRFRAPCRKGGVDVRLMMRLATALDTREEQGVVT